MERYYVKFTINNCEFKFSDINEKTKNELYKLEKHIYNTLKESEEQNKKLINILEKVMNNIK